MVQEDVSRPPTQHQIAAAFLMHWDSAPHSGYLLVSDFTVVQTQHVHDRQSTGVCHGSRRYNGDGLYFLRPLP